MKLLCDTHSHTVASTHAYSTVHDYIRDAKANGLQLFSLTDHAPSMPDAPHMWHFGNQKILPRVAENIAILRAIEANILPASFQEYGNRYVDLPDGVIDYLDFAIASFHEPVFTPGSKKENTRAMIRAMESGLVQILGHAGNPNFPIEQEEVVIAAKANNVLIEINNSSFTHSRKGSKPFCSDLIETVAKHDWKLAVSSDAHFSAHVGLFEQATSLLEALGFPESHITTQNPARFLAFLAEHDKPVSAELSTWLDAL